MIKSALQKFRIIKYKYILNGEKNKKSNLHWFVKKKGLDWFLKTISVNNGSVREMKGFYECFVGKFASHITVPFHCELDILSTSNDGKLFLDKESHAY